MNFSPEDVAAVCDQLNAVQAGDGNLLGELSNRNWCLTDNSQAPRGLIHLNTEDCLSVEQTLLSGWTGTSKVMLDVADCRKCSSLTALEENISVQRTLALARETSSMLKHIMLTMEASTSAMLNAALVMHRTSLVMEDASETLVLCREGLRDGTNQVVEVTGQLTAQMEDEAKRMAVLWKKQSLLQEQVNSHEEKLSLLKLKAEANDKELLEQNQRIAALETRVSKVKDELMTSEQEYWLLQQTVNLSHHRITV